ncbi:MAG: AAA family ATPase, partial [Lachnospiraceae bacterium]|nr:AAA family ATPase [Lachnospiraceae bacterium]
MDERKNLIFIKGENKTWQIRKCSYNKQTQRYDITFNSGESYPYGHTSVQWLKDPEFLNPVLYRIAIDNKELRGICAIYVFKNTSEWWHLVFENGFGRTFHRSNLQVEKTCLDNQRAQSKLSYLRDIAGINELKNDDGEVLLKKQYEKLNFVGEDSALAVYLHPEKHKVKTFNTGPLIFPFGGNASQFKAVGNSLGKQVSVIQGPPGTGKTQTILNIIANLLIRGKTIQVVSNNNSATENVLEKLASPKYNMGFLVATLGKRENKQTFIDEQTGLYPQIDDWKISPTDLSALQAEVAELSKEVAEHFAKQERLAVAKQELDALEVENKYFNQFCEDTKLNQPTKKPRRGLRSEIVLQTLQECEQLSEKEKTFSFWHKLKNSVFYGLYEWKFHNNDIGSIIFYLQSLFYTAKRTELINEIAALQEALAQVDAKQKMDMLTKKSMAYLKAELYNRYGNKVTRPRFLMDAIWKQPYEILKEYPVILSTTFSSRNCLKDVSYDYLIMDEASQVDLATGALALASAKNAVIVGDLKQLPNVIPEDQRKLSEAVFQSYCLPASYNYANNSFLKSICTVIPDLPQTLLREHYRCHPKIIDFCNKKFYQNQLVIMTEDHDETDTLCVFRTV